MDFSKIENLKLIMTRYYITIRGAVQGVGFRPFIMRLAKEMNLKGYVRNSSSGVFIEAEENIDVLDVFINRIKSEKPKISFITNFEYSVLDTVGYVDFQIRNSEIDDEISAIILPDIATCPECISEMLDVNNKRYLYPFINCTNCGPRYSIIEALPYDRHNTTMRIFDMCPDCRTEYENPYDRRYHAQPIACPVCGPHIELWDNFGNIISKNYEAIKYCANEILNGKIIAIKGIGGFQLLADAANVNIVNELRIRKHRDEKPFALMFPTLESIKEACEVSSLEERVLISTESPILILKRKHNISNCKISEKVAPLNPYLGVMLPYSPLHHLLMNEINKPVIATSGNLSEEPICIDETEALRRLKGIADFYLVHNRPIARHVDDSIVRVVIGREMVQRRARGYAPLPIIQKNNDKETILAVGGHLKNSIALKIGHNVFISQHIGDLSTAESYKAFTQVINDLKNIYKVEPTKIIHDLHPEYLSTKYAKNKNLETIGIQHHIAHVYSCRAENQIGGRALGVSWDGTGFGLDGTIWGGEFFLTTDESVKHYAQFRLFPLPGGDLAVKEPRRSALGLLFEMYDKSIFNNLDFNIVKNFKKSELDILKNMLEKNINCPKTSSAGRLFDAVSSILSLIQISNFEGQAAMNLEFISSQEELGSYEFYIKKDKILLIDWQKIIEGIINDLNINYFDNRYSGECMNLLISKISAKFHNTLANIILVIANEAGEKKIILSGGCFQNVTLLEKTVKLLKKNDFQPYWHQRIPTNDGGISLGQIESNEINLVE